MRTQSTLRAAFLFWIMGIESKHAYRFGFLKSDWWKNLRLACLARDDAKCRVCGKRDMSNDAHHVRYRETWRETKLCDLRTLCRDCHEKAHSMIREYGKLTWRGTRFMVRPDNLPASFRGKAFAVRIHDDWVRERSIKRERHRLFAAIRFMRFYVSGKPTPNIAEWNLRMLKKAVQSVRNNLTSLKEKDYRQPSAR